MASDPIIAALKAKEIELAGEIIDNPASINSLFIPIKLVRDATGKQRPSYKQLSELRSDLAYLGYIAEFLLIDREAKSIEEGLRASLLNAFSNIVRNVFVTVSFGAAHIWIDNKKIVSDYDYNEINVHVTKYVNFSSLKDYKIYFISEESLATNTEILVVIRKNSPVTCEDLHTGLIDRGFAVPSFDWINRKLDALRKVGMVVRSSNRSYALTSEALHKLGSRKDRYSPDVGRLLALARRGR